ncbi:hypothetical protein ACHAQJ_007428, partial [Trichoderma viride]
MSALLLGREKSSCSACSATGSFLALAQCIPLEWQPLQSRVNHRHGQVPETNKSPTDAVGELPKCEREESEDVWLDEGGEKANAEHGEEERPEALEDGEGVAEEVICGGERGA